MAAGERLTVALFDPHTEGGGQVTYCLSLVQALATEGHRPILCVRAGSRLEKRGRQMGVDVRPVFQFPRGLRLGGWLADARAFDALLRSEQPDVVHTNNSQDHWLAGLVRGVLRRSFCHVRTRHNTNAVRDSRFNRWVNQSLTDYQIVVCEQVRRTLAQQPVFDAQRLTTIHNGVDTQRFRPDAGARAHMRAHWGYAEDHVVLGIVARLVPAKGHEFLFEAVAQLRDRYPALRVLVLGTGPRELYLRRLAERLAITGITHFAGFHEEMAACVQAIDIGVQPSVDVETSSISAKEIMAAGKPVVASDYGGLPEVVRDRQDGFVVPARTVAPLASAIATLLDDAARRAAMGETARQQVCAVFSLDAFAQATVAAYQHARTLHAQRTAS